MAQKDLSEKILEDYNDVFADNVNAVIFKGEQRVTPESLTNSSVHSQYRADDKKLHEQERDVIKYWNKNSVKIAICGIENQSNPDKAMPIRVFGYEGASYRQQLSSSENNNTNDRKTYIPVVTLILYFGTKTRWCKKRSLKKY